jgi:hypothetical protein
VATRSGTRQTRRCRSEFERRLPARALSNRGRGAGARAAYTPSPRSALVVGAEYLHYMLESDTIVPLTTTSLNPLIELGDHVHINNVDVVRLRASWLSNLGP